MLCAAGESERARPSVGIRVSASGSVASRQCDAGSPKSTIVRPPVFRSVSRESLSRPRAWDTLVCLQMMDGLFEMTPVEPAVVERGPVDKTFRHFDPDQAWLVRCGCPGNTLAGDRRQWSTRGRRRATRPRRAPVRRGC